MKSNQKVAFSRLSRNAKNSKKMDEIWWRKKFDFSLLKSNFLEKVEFSRLKSAFEEKLSSAG